MTTTAPSPAWVTDWDQDGEDEEWAATHQAKATKTGSVKPGQDVIDVDPSAGDTAFASWITEDTDWAPVPQFVKGIEVVPVSAVNVEVGWEGPDYSYLFAQEAA